MAKLHVFYIHSGAFLVQTLPTVGQRIFLFVQLGKRHYDFIDKGFDADVVMIMIMKY